MPIFSIKTFISCKKFFGRKGARFNSLTGFTVIELIITVAIMVFLLGLGLLVSIDFYKSYALISEKATLVSFLRKARSRALVNFNQSNHGFYISPTQYIIFQGPSYASRSSTWDQVFGKAAGINTSGLEEIVFGPLTATSSASGTIYLNDSRVTTTIEINYEGRINW